MEKYEMTSFQLNLIEAAIKGKKTSIEYIAYLIEVNDESDLIQDLYSLKKSYRIDLLALTRRKNRLSGIIKE